MLADTSPIAWYRKRTVVEQGRNSPYSVKNVNAIGTSSSSLLYTPRTEYRPQSKNSSLNFPNAGGRPRVASKSIAIPKLQNNTLWFDDEKSSADGDRSKYASRKAITRHKAKFSQTNFIQDNKKTQYEESRTKAEVKNAESSSNMYIEKWARSRRSSSDNEPTSLSPDTPPKGIPPKERGLDCPQNSHMSNAEGMVSTSPSATRKRRGSKVSSDMRQDNFKRQHTNQNHIESGSNIDDWGWFVDVPFSPEKMLSPKGLGRRKKSVSSYSEKEVEGETKRPPGPILSCMTQQVDERNQKQREANDGASGDRSGKPAVSMDQSFGAQYVATTESNVIGTSNSLLKLWEKASISKVSSAEQALNQIGSTTKEYLETTNPTLNHVSSFCFEMDL